MTFSKFTVAALATLSAIAIACGVVLPASAHTEHISSTPATGSTLSSVTSLTFTFSEPLLPEFTEVSLMTSNGLRIALNPVQTDETRMVISATFANGPLSDARYRAGYFIVAADGQPVKSTINFTVSGSGVSNPESPPTPDEPDTSASSGQEPAMSTEPSTSATTSPAPSNSTLTPTPKSSAVAIASGDSATSDPSGLVIGISAVVVAGALTGVAIVLLRRRQKTSSIE